MEEKQVSINSTLKLAHNSIHFDTMYKREWTLLVITQNKH